MALETTSEQVEGRVPITVLSLDGELDASNYLGLIDTVGGLYAAGTRHLLIDLTDLRFCASSGLVALYSAVRIMRGEQPPDPEAGWDTFHSMEHESSGGASQTDVQLAGPQPGVARVLQRTGMDRLFIIHPDRATAIAAF
jgi:anti-anti-sigma factor